MVVLQKKVNTETDLFGKICDFAYAACCTLGLAAIRKGKLVGRALIDFSASLKNAAKKTFSRIGTQIKKPISVVAKEWSSIFYVLFRAPVRAVKQIVKAYKAGGAAQAATCFVNILRNTGRLVLNSMGIVMSYLLPIGAAALLAVTINTGIGKDYAIRVICNDQVLGIIEDESVYYEGEDLMRARIQYSNEDEVHYFIPQFEVVRTSDRAEYSDPYMICNELIRSSGNVFQTAYGLYVDDVFYGATVEGEALGLALETLLNTYATGAENEIVRFHNDVRIREGLYLDGSLVPLSKLENLINSKVDYEATYTVVKNDSPHKIASKNGISLETLTALNPGITENCQIGQQVIVSEERPLLSVETVVTEEREIKVDYDSVTIPDKTMSYGKSVVTRPGKKGTAIETTEKIYVSGIIAEEKVISTEIIKQPVTEKVRRGTRLSTSIKPSQGDGSFDFKFRWPLRGGYQTYGIHGYKGHTGMDIGGVPIGTPIYASAPGTVIKSVKNKYGYGYHIIIDHGNGVQTLYAHCSKLYAQVGDVVEAGEKIALVGATGNADGKHLHFEIRINGEYKDPADYIGTNSWS